PWPASSPSSISAADAPIVARSCSRTRTAVTSAGRTGGRRVWIPALERAGVAYFRAYDLRHTCATLLLYEGRTVNEVVDHLGHADPGFTARTRARHARRAKAAACPAQPGDPRCT